MKKRILLSLLIALSLYAGSLVWRSNRILGAFSGAENESVVFYDGTTYSLCDDDDNTHEYGWLLGKITGSYNSSEFVFSVRGDSSMEYIFVASMGQGELYKRIN